MQTANPRRAQTLTVINLKGGVGKTHTAWLMAGVCMERRSKLLVIDSDPQGNLSRSLLDAADQQPGVEQLFDPRQDADPAALIRKTRFDQVDLIPASPALVEYDLAHQQTWEQADLQFSMCDPIAEFRTIYDYIIFDCPPRLSLVSFAALCASDHVVIPLEAADWGAQGIVQVTEAVEHVRQRYNPNLQLLGYLVSRYKKVRKYQRAYLARLRQHFGTLAFDTVVPDRAIYERSVSNAVPITLYAPASEEAGIARRLFAEIDRRISRSHRAGNGRRRSSVQFAGNLAV